MRPRRRLPVAVALAEADAAAGRSYVRPAAISAEVAAAPAAGCDRCCVALPLVDVAVSRRSPTRPRLPDRCRVVHIAARTAEAPALSVMSPDVEIAVPLIDAAPPRAAGMAGR
jgi:hypothetical protein